MFELLRTWWPVLLLVYLPSLVTTIMRIAITRAFRQLDRSHPDDLAQTAGTWLSHEVMRRGLRGYVRTVVTDNDAKLSFDAYHPFQGVIQLSAETFFKRDPMHWAIAAHELGHARFHMGWPVLGRLIIAALYVKRTLIAIAAALVVGNVAFALPHITDLAFLLFALSAALHWFVLLDEIVASVLAMQSLRESPHFAWSHMRSARTLLVLAFSTYLVGFLSRVLLLTQWPIVEALTRVPLVPPVMQLTTFGLALAIVVTVVLVAAALWQLVSMFADLRGRIAIGGGIVALLAKPALLVLVLLVWNVRAGADHAYYVMLALIQAQGLFVLAVMLPMIIVDVLVFDRFARKLVVEPLHRTLELMRDYAAGAAQRKRGNLAIADLIAKAQTSPPVEHRVLQVLHFSYLPLLITFWLS